MSTSPQIEPVPTEQLLTCLGMAIDEAKLVRTIITSKNLATRLEAEGPVPYRLTLLNREIELLEAKLAKVREKYGSDSNCF